MQWFIVIAETYAILYPLLIGTFLYKLTAEVETLFNYV